MLKEIVLAVGTLWTYGLYLFFIFMFGFIIFFQIYESIIEYKNKKL